MERVSNALAVKVPPKPLGHFTSIHCSEAGKMVARRYGKSTTSRHSRAVLRVIRRRIRSREVQRAEDPRDAANDGAAVALGGPWLNARMARGGADHTCRQLELQQQRHGRRNRRCNYLAPWQISTFEMMLLSACAICGFAVGYLF